MNRTTVFAAAIFALIFSAGCNKGAGKNGTGADGDKGPAASQNIRQLKELKKIDEKVGTGPEVRTGDLVYITYTGTLKDGTEFDSNDKSDAAPYTVVLGAQAVIPGWDQGIPGMKVGGVRRLEIPTDLAYGNQGSGEKVPPGADLYFTVRLDEAVRKGEEGMFEKKDIKVGTGAAVKMGCMVDVNYSLKLANGKLADVRSNQEKPISFRIGPKLTDTDRVVPIGIYTAMIGMKEGGVRYMRIPPDIGFAQSSNTSIPPNSLVLIELTLRKVY